jgi:hypothetical protein
MMTGKLFFQLLKCRAQMRAFPLMGYYCPLLNRQEF